MDVAILIGGKGLRTKKISEKIIKEENIKFLGKIVTKTSLVKNYCLAEEYHQRYLEKR